MPCLPVVACCMSNQESLLPALLVCLRSKVHGVVQEQMSVVLKRRQTLLHMLVLFQAIDAHTEQLIKCAERFTPTRHDIFESGCSAYSAHIFC